jgi:hypothetical protein
MLGAAGRIDRSVSADTPFYAVFREGTARTYVAYNPRSGARTVRFSDGASVDVPPLAFGVGRGVAPVDRANEADGRSRE